MLIKKGALVRIKNTPTTQYLQFGRRLGLLLDDIELPPGYQRGLKEFKGLLDRLPTVDVYLFQDQHKAFFRLSEIELVETEEDK